MLGYFQTTLLFMLALLGAGCASEQVRSQKDYERLKSGRATDGYIRRAVNQLEESPDNIWRAGSPLGKYGERAQAAVPVLIGYLDSDDWTVRSQAAKALGGFGPLAAEAAPKLEALVRENGFEVRIVIMALGDIQTESSIPLLLETFYTHPEYERALATALSRYPDEVLARYGSMDRSVEVVLGPTAPRLSTREPLWINDRAQFLGKRRIDGVWREADLEGYEIHPIEIVHVVTTPSGKVYRLTLAPAYTNSLPIMLCSSRDLLLRGGYEDRPWVQDDAPSFQEDGQYRLRLQGEFKHAAPERHPLPFVSNEITFELSPGFPTREELAQMEEAAFRRHYPLGRYFVHGEVEHTGSHGLTQGLTLRDAILLAKRTRLARGAIRLTRETPKGKTMREFEFEDIMETDVGEMLIESGDVIIVLECLVEGTRVLTEHGERPVETLQVGGTAWSRLTPKPARKAWLA